jgi:hypothetical protein
VLGIQQGGPDGKPSIHINDFKAARAHEFGRAPVRRRGRVIGRQPGGQSIPDFVTHVRGILVAIEGDRPYEQPDEIPMKKVQITGLSRRRRHVTEASGDPEGDGPSAEPDSLAQQVLGPRNDAELSKGHAPDKEQSRADQRPVASWGPPGYTHLDGHLFDRLYAGRCPAVVDWGFAIPYIRPRHMAAPAPVRRA